MARHRVSKVYDVLHTDINNPSTSLVESICKESAVTNTNIPAIKQGTDNNKNAITQYTELQRNQGHQMMIQKLLELKCPFPPRETVKIEVAVPDTDFFYR